MQLTTEEQELRRKFENWAMKIQTNFIESPLFQPVGLELSCTALVLETKSDCQIAHGDVPEDSLPIAYYRPGTDSIHVFIEHSAFRKRESDQEKYAFLMFLLFHEANHRLLLHIRRGKGKDATLWNIAADMEIHNMLYVYYEIMKSNVTHQASGIWRCMANYVRKFLFDKDDPDKCEGLWERCHLQDVAEEIYNSLEQSKVETAQEFSVGLSDGDGQGGYAKAKVTVSKYTSKGGKEFTVTSVEFDERYGEGLSDSQRQERENSAMARKAMMENALQRQYDENVRQKGAAGSPCCRFLKTLFRVKVDWRKILRGSLQTALEKSEQFSWARPRTSLFGLPGQLYLPAQWEDGAYGTLIIARDESGSVSNDDCRKAASIILEAKDHYSKIVLIRHDTSIVSVDEFTEVDDRVRDMALTRKAMGGTSHREVFEFIRGYQTREDGQVSCCVFITDMCSDIEETQGIIRDDIPRIYLCPMQVKEKGLHPKVKGEVIGIE